MGRIKSLMVKRAAKQLLAGSTLFNEKFDYNKKVMADATLPSKSVRNKIAGYIARLNKMKLVSVQREARRQAREAERKAKLMAEGKYTEVPAQ